MAAYYPQDYGPHRHNCSAPPYLAGAAPSWRRRVKARLLEKYYAHPPAPSGNGGLLERILTGPLLYPLYLYFRLSGRDPSLIPFVGEGRILDVGCGLGIALAVYRERGWTPFGVEPSPVAARYAREVLGLSVHQGEFLDARLPSGFADVVLFRHSLEHVPHPSVELREAHRVLRGSGLLVVMVPNAASLDARLFGRWWVAWDLPRHLFHFTPRTASELLGKAGFRVQRIVCDPGPFTFVESALYVGKYQFGTRSIPRPLLRLAFRPLSGLFALLTMTGVMTLFCVKA
jgi:SAM-dependent methyltransferase